MKNDQWFEPGDKVMRVHHEREFGGAEDEPLPNEPVKGAVYCVESCYPMKKRNVITLVGYPHPWIWVATDFRKVEEIKLCVTAAEKAKQLTPQHA